MELGLANKHVIVTGGAGGIGKEIVKLLYQEGSKVSLHYHSSKEEALNIQDSCNKNRVYLVQGDLREEKEVTNIFSSAIDNFGRIDCLVANAGIWAHDQLLTSDISIERWNNTLKTNLTGVFLCVREFFRNLQKFPKKNASIVLIGSTAGEIGEAGHADYSASKAALMYGLTKTWKNEIINFAPQGRINCVAPGWVFTDMAEKSLEDEDTLRTILQTIPLSKIALPNDIATAIAFLLSDKVSGHISGETIMIQGGMEGRILHEKDRIDLSFIDNARKKD